MGGFGLGIAPTLKQSILFPGRIQGFMYIYNQYYQMGAKVLLLRLQNK